MAFALVNATTSPAVVNNGSVTIPATTLGNIIVVLIAGSATGRTVSSIVDGSNTYSIDKEQSQTNATAHMASCVDSVGGITSITINMSGSTTMHVDILEFSGVKPSAYVGLSSAGTDTTGTALSVASFTPTAASLIVAVGGAGGNRVFTHGTNYTAGSTDEGSSVRGLSQYKLSAPGTAETAPITIGASSSWSEVAVEYFPAAGDVEVTPSPVAVPIVLAISTLAYEVAASSLIVPVAFADPTLEIAAIADPVTVPIAFADPTLGYETTSDALAVPIVIPTPTLDGIGDVEVTPNPVVISIGFANPTLDYESAATPIAVPVEFADPILLYAVAPDAIAVPIEIPVPNTGIEAAPSPIAIPIVIPIPTIDEGGDKVAPDPVVVVITFPDIVFTITDELICPADWTIDEFPGEGTAPSDDEFVEEPILVGSASATDWSIG